MSAHLAASIAVATSILAVLGCCLFVPVLWSKMSSIESKVKLDLEQFKAMEDDIMGQISEHRREKPRTLTRTARHLPSATVTTITDVHLVLLDHLEITVKKVNLGLLVKQEHLVCQEIFHQFQPHQMVDAAYVHVQLAGRLVLLGHPVLRARRATLGTVDLLAILADQDHKVHLETLAILVDQVMLEFLGNLVNREAEEDEVHLELLVDLVKEDRVGLPDSLVNLAIVEMMETLEIKDLQERVAPLEFPDNQVFQVHWDLLEKMPNTVLAPEGISLA